MATRVSQYFCIFCSFKCDEYENAINHYRSHMFVKNNCEICDYKFGGLNVYISDPSCLDYQCEHSGDPYIKHRSLAADNWINDFLGYQRKLLNTTYAKLFSRGKVCVECAVCRYLVDGYKKNGGDMAHIQYSNDDVLTHLYAHLRYSPKPNELALQSHYKKLELFISHWSDNFFTCNDLMNVIDIVSNEETDECLPNWELNHYSSENQCLYASPCVAHIPQHPLVGNYFCVFCSFKCDEYGNAFNHYKSHMFVKDSCEICDYSKSYIYEVDLVDQCDHKDTSWSKQYLKNKFDIINIWTHSFLGYQTKLLNTTYTQLLLANKVCVECTVCRYLVENYKKNGGEVKQIQYISGDKLEHCYAHLRYDPKSIQAMCKSNKINDFNTTIRILDALISHWCDSFFTADFDDNVYNLSSNEETDSISVTNIHANKLFSDDDSDCSSYSQLNECSSQLAVSACNCKSPSVDDIREHLLAPIFAKLTSLESAVDEIKKQQLEINKKLTNDRSMH